jgi:hypothetical protein
MDLSRKNFLKTSLWGGAMVLLGANLSCKPSKIETSEKIQTTPQKQTSGDPYTLKKLAIYYGWPSAAHGLEEGPLGADHAIQVFSQFDAIILGGGVESPKHGDYDNVKHIVSSLQKKEIQGYVYFSTLKEYNPLSESELVQRVNNMDAIGMSGVIFDQLHPNYKSSVKRIKKTAEAAHDRKMHVTYNTDFSAAGNWLEERISPYAKEGDLVLVEPFGTSWLQDACLIPEELHPSFLKLRDKGVKIIGVSTYNVGIEPSKTEVLTILEPKDRDVLLKRFLKCRQDAQRLKLDDWQFTNGLYSASGKEANLLVNYDALTKR